MLRPVMHGYFIHRKAVIVFLCGVLCGFFTSYSVLRFNEFPALRQGGGLGSLMFVPDSPYSRGEFDLDMTMQDAQLWNGFQAGSYDGKSAFRT